MLADHVQRFIEQGYTTLPLGASIGNWLTEAEQRATTLALELKEDAGWINGPFDREMPDCSPLAELLNELLVQPWQRPPSGQLSSLIRGYGSSTAPNIHVDGAHEGLNWFGLLLGIHLVDVPAGGDAGNLLVYPGSHKATYQRFAALGNQPSLEAVRDAIRTALPQAVSPFEIAGPRGTTVVMDHRLYHAMAPQTRDYVRHVVYYRLPFKTSIPVEVVNPRHFLRRGWGV